MSVIAEGTELFPCSAIPLVTSSQSPVDGSSEVVATLDTGVQLFNAAGNRLESSWSVSPGKLLTCAAFRHCSTGSLVCVEDGSVLCTWPQSAKTLAKASRRTFRKGIHSAHSRAQACGADTIVVQQDGRVVLVGAGEGDAVRPARVSERLQGFLDPSPGQVVHAEVASSGGKQAHAQHALCVLRQVEGEEENEERGRKGRRGKKKQQQQQQQQQQYVVVDLYGFVLGDHFTEESQCKLLGSHRLDVPAGAGNGNGGGDGGVVSCSFQLTSQGNRTLSLLWASGLWQVLAFPSSSVAAGLDMALRQAPRVLFQRELGCFAKDDSGAVVASTAFVSPAYLAIAGKPAGTKGGGGKRKGEEEDAEQGCIVTVWETLYGTLQGHTSLPGPTNKQQKRARRRKTRGTVSEASSSRRQVTVLGGADKRTVLVVQGHAVQSCPVTSTPPSLASSLGIMTATAPLLQEKGAPALEPPLFFTANPMPLLQGMKAKKKKKRKRDQQQQQQQQQQQDKSSSSSASSASSAAAAADAVAARPLWGTHSQAVTNASASWEKSFEAADEAERKVLAQLCPENEGATPGVKKFTRVFDGYVNRVEAAGELATAHVAGKLDKQGRKKGKDLYRENRMMTLLSERFVTTVAQRCLRRGLWGPLRTLIDTNALSARVLPDLVSGLVAHKQLQLLERSLVHMHDVPESDLVLVLQSVLTEGAWDEQEHESDESQDKRREAAESMQQQQQQQQEQDLSPHDQRKRKKQRKAAAAVSSSSSTPAAAAAATAKRKARPEALLLHLVLSAPRSDAVLKRSLRHLSTQQALKLLGHLHKWMTRYWLATEQEVKVLFRDSGLRAPTFGQVLDWTRMTLDAHFKQLVQDPQPEVQNMAKDLQFMVVGQHLHLCREMASMRGLLATFNKQQAGGPKPSKPLQDYSLVTLRV